jgi:AraC-like DNA-binding protein
VISFGPLGEAQPVRVCLRIASTMVGELMREIHGRGTGTPSVGQLITPDPLLVGLVRAFLATLSTPSSLLERTSRAQEMLTRIVRVHTAPSGTERSPRTERALVRRVRSYLDENPSTNISLTDLARQVSVSAYYLNRVFSAEVGMPPHAHQTQVRIERGKRLLAQGLPVHRVAAELGFYDQSHFTNQFRRLLGYPPSAYRDRKNLQA